MPETLNNSELEKQARILELQKVIEGIDHLFKEKVISYGAKKQLELSLAEYQKELAQLTGQSENQEKLAA